MTATTLRSGATQHAEDNVLQLLTDLVLTGGVLTKASNNLLIEAQASPNMTVKVNTGRGYVKKTGNAYPFICTASENVNITSNGSGNPRKDAIVAYANLSATPTSVGGGVITFVAVAGTPAASPVAPDATAIATAIGASNPYIILAEVTVASGASSIVGGNITDVRTLVEFVSGVMGGQVLKIIEQSTAPSSPASTYGLIYLDSNGRLHTLFDDSQNRLIGEESWVALTDGATIDIDCSLGKKFWVVLGGNRTLTLSNVTDGKDIRFRVGQDGTGTRLISTWPTKSSTFATTDVTTATDIIVVGRNVRTGTPIKFSSTGGVPTGLVAGTTYYAINNNSTSIKVASSLANAQAGTQIDLTSQGTGTHTLLTLIRWAGGSEPTLTTGKYRFDTFVINVMSATDGDYEGYTAGTDV